MQRSEMKTTLGAIPPYALFFLLTYSELQRRIVSLFADLSAEMDDSTHLFTTPLTQSTALGVVNRVIHFRWKGGVWLSTALEVPWHRVDSLEHSDAERVSLFDSMLDFTLPQPRARGCLRLLISAVLGFAENLFMRL